MRRETLRIKSRKANITRLVKAGMKVKEAIHLVNQLEENDKPIIRTVYPDRVYGFNEVFQNVHNSLRSA